MITALQVITGISDAELTVLDAFEDYEYVRRTVQISLTVSFFSAVVTH
jgi:hypothetical protein